MKTYNKLYLLQDKFLSLSMKLKIPYYLTGGTAIGRFYLNHRYCDGLYFNVEEGARYLEYMAELKIKIEENFYLDATHSFYNEDFTRFFIVEDGVNLTVDLVRNTKNHEGKLTNYEFGLIDSPLFILPKKLSALPWRNESKDIYDVVYIASNYSFNWADIFIKIKQNSTVKIHEIESRITNFPVDIIKNADWLKTPLDSMKFKKELDKVAHDFSSCIENSLGTNLTPLMEAKIL